MLFALLGAHFFFDYAGQGEYMAKGKNPNTPWPDTPYWSVLFGHAMIHGAAVALITQVWWIGLLETIIHGTTDLAKCNGHINFNTDQTIHVICKVIWVLAIVGMAH